MTPQEYQTERDRISQALAEARRRRDAAASMRDQDERIKWVQEVGRLSQEWRRLCMDWGGMQ